MLTVAGLLVATLLAGQPLAPDGWTFSEGPEFPGAKGRLEVVGNDLVLHYDFSGGGNYVAAYHEMEPTEVNYFSLQVRKPSAMRLTFRVVDETGQSLQKGLSFAAGDWQRVEVLNGGWTGHWGGANNGRTNGKLRSFGVLAENIGLDEKAGQVILREVTVNEGTAPESGLLTSTYEATDFAGAGQGWGPSASSQWADGVWRYHLTEQAQAAWLSGSVSLFGEPESVTISALGGQPGQKLSLKLGSHFQTFERELGELTGGPVEFTVDLPPKPGWKWYGGENDGAVHRPLRLAGLVVSGPAGPASELRGLRARVTTLSAPSEALVLTPRPAVQRGAGLVWSTEVLNLLTSATTAQASLRIARWDGTPVAEQAFALNLAPGQRANLEATGEASESALVGQWSISGGPAASAAETSYIPPTAPAAPGTPAEPDSPWGMGVYLYRYPNHPSGLAEMDRAAGLAAAAGVKWTREEFQWHRLEPAEGQYDWTFYDALVDTAERHGISVYGLLAYWSGWSKDYTLEGIEEYCRWAKAVVERYRGRVNHWEIWNEPNIFFWSGPKELYPVMLKRAYETIKAADPKAEVLGCSTAGIDFDFIRRCVEAGAPFDALTVHPYRGALNEDGFVKELLEAGRAAGDKPVWITEMGWPTQFRGGVTESEQARLLARCYLSAVGGARVRSMSWYNYRDDGTDPYYNESCFGVLRRDFSPKPAYRALSTICRSLPGARDGQAVDLGPGWQAWRYETNQGPAFALWPEQTQVVRLSAAAGARTVGLLGDEAPITGELLMPANTPLLVLGSDTLGVQPGGWRLEAPASVRPGAELRLALTGQGLPADCRIRLRSATLGQAEGVRELSLTVPAVLPAGRHELGVELLLGQRTMLWPLSLEVLPEVVRG